MYYGNMAESKTKRDRMGTATARVGLMACGSLMANVLSKMMLHAAKNGDEESHSALRAIGYKLEAVRQRLDGENATADILDLVAKDAISNTPVSASASVSTSMRGRVAAS